MLIHLVADYGPGDLAAAEVRAGLAVHVPGAEVTYTPVGPFDTIAAGFCVAQLALGGGPAERLAYHNEAAAPPSSSASRRRARQWRSSSRAKSGRVEQTVDR